MASQVEQLKNEGNKHFAAGNHAEAIKVFSEAIALAPDNHILFSNRSASYASLKDYKNALNDAKKCVELQPKWSKGYNRLGAAYHGLGQLEQAEEAYSKGLEIEPDNAALKKALDDVVRAQMSSGAGPSPNLDQIFSSPNALAKIAANPRTAAYLQQSDFIAKFQELQRDPKALGKHLQDPRIMEVLGILMGVDIKTAAPGDEDIPMETTTKPNETKPTEKPAEKPAEKAAPQDNLTEEERAIKQKKEEAAKEKELGTEAYKKRSFDDALAHYTRANELDPEDITHLNNIAAVLLETKQYEKCIETCQQAVEKGRELRADYKVIARSLGRIGTAYHRLDNLAEAIKYYNKSLTEHRTPDILAKLREAEKLKEDREKAAYIDPALSDQEREKGNTLFKNGDYPNAIKAYNEAIKRNPNDARNYTNRASAYLKILAYPEALRDCEDAIRVDPSYAKAYVRKAAVQFAMKKYNECLSTLAEATEKDVDNKNQTEIQQQRTKTLIAMQTEDRNMTPEEVNRRAQQDPEVQEIWRDPSIQSILQQMSEDPQAFREHMKNPNVAKKLKKLIDVGLIRIGTS